MGWQRKAQKEQKKQKKQIIKHQRTRGFNDLLGYLMLADEKTLLHKDGAFSQHFEYLAPDLDSCTDVECVTHSETWRHALAFLGDGWMVETNVITDPYRDRAPSRTFPDVVSALIDDERRLQFQSSAYFKTRYYLSITWRPHDAVTNAWQSQQGMV